MNETGMQVLYTELIGEQEICVSQTMGNVRLEDEGLTADLVITNNGILEYGTTVHVSIFEVVNGIGSDSIIRWKKLLDPANR